MSKELIAYQYYLTLQMMSNLLLCALTPTIRELHDKYKRELLRHIYPTLYMEITNNIIENYYGT